MRLWLCFMARRITENRRAISRDERGPKTNARCSTRTKMASAANEVRMLIMLGLLLSTTLVTLASVTAAPMSQQDYARAMGHTPTPHPGCFQSTYPIVAWNEVQCASRAMVPAYVGDGTDHSAKSGSSYMGYASGDFSTSGITSESDSYYGSNYYSLQINSQFFTCTPAGGSTADCWEQFVFQNSPVSGSNSLLYIEYWLIDYTAVNNVGNCPSTAPWSGWNLAYDSYTGLWSCWGYTQQTTLGNESPTNLSSLTFTGESDLSNSANDVAQLCDGGGCYSRSVSDSEFQLFYYWNEAEFNVFGHGTPPGGSASTANFNSGSSITVNVYEEDTNSNSVSPSCGNGAFTAETNNLTLGSCTAVMPPLAHIYFSES